MHGLGSGQTALRRAVRVGYYALPLVFCVWLHALALRTWFHNDDFAWLGLKLLVHSPGELLHALFDPMAQGTVRVLSERVYFLAFSNIFGLNALPFHVWAFLTQFANLILLSRITIRLTGSNSAGLIAPLLWTANYGLPLALGWSSAYNEILFAFFLLLSFFFLLKYVQTGNRKFWFAQWITFILGFGALELIAIYPILAAGYSLCCARKLFRRTLYLFIPSVLFTVWHFVYVPKAGGPYRFHFDSSILIMAWRYWLAAITSARPEEISRGALVWAFLLMGALLIFVLRNAYDRNWVPLFCLSWFFVVLLPVLPLKDHFMEYYLTGATAGLAMLAGLAFAQAWRAPWIVPWHLMRAASLILIGAYLWLSIPATRAAERYFRERSRGMQALVNGLIAGKRAHPTPVVLLSGVNDDLFWAGFNDDPFGLIGVKVYLLPGSESSIDPSPEPVGVSKFVLAPAQAVNIIDHAEIYAMQGRRLQRVTNILSPALLSQYRDLARNFVDVGDPESAPRLGGSWYEIQDGYRWMSKTASVHLAAVHVEHPVLYLSGYGAPSVLAKGPLDVTFRTDGQPIGAVKLTHADKFDASFPLPQKLGGSEDIQVTIEVSRTTIVPPDPRQLGVVFGTFTIK